MFYSTNDGLHMQSEHGPYTLVADRVNKITIFQVDNIQHVLIFYTAKSLAIHKMDLISQQKMVDTR